MKIVVLTGSHRHNSNSSRLAQKFIEGARDAGHQVTRFDCAKANLGPCIACDKCRTSGSCWQLDDFVKIRQDLIEADAIVFASPIYYFALSAQIKTVIDRFYSIDDKLHTPKHTALLLTYADSDTQTAEAAIRQWELTSQFLGWEMRGIVSANSVMSEGDIEGRDELQEAYALGKNI